MSCIHKGEIIDTNLSHSAMGGTEQMRARLLNGVDTELLKNVAIHLSRVREIYKDVSNILWCHDLSDDIETKILENGGWKQFSKLVFVSCWQRDSYTQKFDIPYSRCLVIENAIEPAEKIEKPSGRLNLIYHTTPHRGLEILYPVFDALTQFQELKNRLHLDVFSSFGVYGWKERDKNYQSLFQKLHDHPNITYHGAQSNQVVREYLAKAHYFPYPCIWKETSCIALIEAIEHDVVAIHPNLAALPETAGQNTYMYDYTDNLEDHVNRFYHTLLLVLRHDLRHHKEINSSPRHNIKTFQNKWTALLKEYNDK
jgi:UDP-glucose:(glucosyl)LPS alpha-1,2-glucosyltransferase